MVTINGSDLSVYWPNPGGRATPRSCNDEIDRSYAVLRSLLRNAVFPSVVKVKLKKALFAPEAREKAAEEEGKKGILFFQKHTLRESRTEPSPSWIQSEVSRDRKWESHRGTPKQRPLFQGGNFLLSFKKQTTP